MNETDGSTAIEYAMIACFISIVILTMVTSIGVSVKGFFTALLVGL